MLAKRGKSAAVIVALIAGLFGSRAWSDPAADQAVELHRLLTGGVALYPENPLYGSVVTYIRAGDYRAAARAITDPRTGAPEFYNNLVADTAHVFNRLGTPAGPRNEIDALWLGVTRDNLTLDDLLSADVVFYDPTLTGGNAYPTANHYVEMWRSRNPRDALIQGQRPGMSAVGIFTTGPWGENYHFMGTGRRNWRGVVENLYCSTLEAVQAKQTPQTFIRRDVPRPPVEMKFSTSCVLCHATMDALIPPFLEFDYIGNTVVRGFRDRINELNFATYVVTDTTGKVFYTPENESIFGYQNTDGISFAPYGDTGVMQATVPDLAAFGKLIAHSSGFHRCMVKRIIAQIYMRRLYSFATFSDADHAVLNTQANTIEAFTALLGRGTRLKPLYEEIAIHYLRNRN